MRGSLRGTVLCVDDDEGERQALTLLLKGAGCEVAQAATGEEALRLAAGQPGLVVLDVNLPDIDGFEVCRRIKAHPATAAIPVLHLSGVFVTPADVSQARAGGADGYLTKPIDPQVLLARAEALLRDRPAEGAPQVLSRSGLTKEEAEDWLDWLEANGYQGLEVHHADGEGFVVRWQASEGAACPGGAGGGAGMRDRRLREVPADAIPRVQQGVSATLEA
jgi:DNA-binding response OmpR family regulator